MSHQMFFAMLNQYPRLKPLWDEEKRELKVDLFEKSIDVLSTGEEHLARFFASVWFGSERRYPFDLVDAVASLDARSKRTIAEWIANPFWP